MARRSRVELVSPRWAGESRGEHWVLRGCWLGAGGYVWDCTSIHIQVRSDMS